MNLITGRYGEYHWLESDDNSLFLSSIIEIAPEYFLNKYLAIIAMDSGQFTPSNDELRSGWYIKREIAYSPRLTEKILHNGLTHGFDEWYLFNNKTELLVGRVFVNYDNFSLVDTNNHLTKEFWDQLVINNPDHYIHEGNRLIIATKEEGFFSYLEKHCR